MQSRETERGARVAGAVACSLIAGLLLPNSMQVGLQFAFRGNDDIQRWSAFFWGEHWAVRTLASACSSFAAGLIAGAIGRSRGRIAAVIAALPSTAIWALLAYGAWMGSVPFLPASQLDVSIGNKLAASVLAAASIPLAAVGGEYGGQFGLQMAEYFDNRPRSLLGIRWYHYLWLPILLHLIIAQTFWAGLYGLQWTILSWRQGVSLISLIPSFFMLGIWASIAITWFGCRKAYETLSGLERHNTRADATKAVLKNAIGLPLLATLLQATITLLHAGLAKLIS